MPWILFCPVCEGKVKPPHQHHEAFPFHYRAGKKPASQEDIQVLGRVMQAARVQLAPWCDPGWSTEADEEGTGFDAP
jgi:hypothetical protein